ncbi:MAG: CRISPR-associated endonuclease Cas3'' [Verrucomicrobiota bacterium]
MKFYAHTTKTADGKPDLEESHWQPLATHLNNVAGAACKMAAFFQASDHARLAGLLHDLGEAQAEFQSYLRDPKKKVVHASHGAALALGDAEDKNWKRNWPVAFAINGHHAGHRDKKTVPFVAKDAELVFKDDDPRRGLYRLVSSSLYEGIPHGAGLDVSGKLGHFEYCL